MKICLTCSSTLTFFIFRVLFKSATLSLLAVLTLFQANYLYGQEQVVGLPPDPDAMPDFSGAWQKDYRRSDDWEQEVNFRLNQMRRDFERAQGRGDTQAAVRIANQSRGGNTLIDLARFAELISRHNDIYIDQTGDQIVIRRDNEADLICDFADDPIYTFSDQFGSEACGWAGDQLLFRIRLPGEIAILYRFSVDKERRSLNLQTRISSHETLSFDLEEYFLRYELPPEQYECTQTLTRGRVCSLSGDL